MVFFSKREEIEIEMISESEFGKQRSSPDQKILSGMILITEAFISVAETSQDCYLCRSINKLDPNCLILTQLQQIEPRMTRLDPYLLN